MTGKTTYLCFGSALIACMCGGALAERPALPVTHARGQVHRIVAAAPGKATLYEQNDDDAGFGVISTDFDEFFDSFDSQGADDFIVPAGHTWKIRQVEVTGAYSVGPADSESVFFYGSRHRLPGRLVAGCENLAGTDDQGSFAIRFPKSCRIVLAGGHRYWLSVVAHVNFECCGQWNWETRNGRNGLRAAWENPNDGFDTGCTTWGVAVRCVGEFGEGPDFMFALKGVDTVP